jgi:hypothetical protein
MKEMNVYEIVTELIGPIDPVAAEHIDDKRLENLKHLCDVIEMLLYDVRKVRDQIDRHEHSVKKAAEYADTFFLMMTEEHDLSSVQDCKIKLMKEALAQIAIDAEVERARETLEELKKMEDSE